LVGKTLQSAFSMPSNEGSGSGSVSSAAVAIEPINFF
jgi:hypothetical protein